MLNGLPDENETGDDEGEEEDMVYDIPLATLIN